MAEGGFRLFHRVVQTNPPTIADFRSSAAKGVDPPADPALRAVWDGVSVYSTANQARRKRRTSPVLGDYVAVLRVPTDGSIRFARTLGGDGRHTLWAGPSVLIELVVSVVSA